MYIMTLGYELFHYLYIQVINNQIIFFEKSVVNELRNAGIASKLID
jgi:hypothetical protein